MKAEGKTWESDLAEAHKLEDEFAQLLKTEYNAIEVIQAPKQSSFLDWDVTASWSDYDISFELKQDRGFARTGNIAVEYGRTVNGIFKETAIAVTKADVIAYYFPQEQDFYLIETKDLKKMMVKCRKAIGGDGNRAHLYLVPKTLFLSKAIKFKKHND